MKWRIVKKPPVGVKEWHTVFLWKPIKQDDYKYWLCFILRRQLTFFNNNKHLPHSWHEWEYKEPVYV